MQPSVCVCLSVFFLTDATHPLGIPGPAGAGPRQFPLFLHLFAKKWWPDAMILVFWMLGFKPTFSFSSFTFIKRLLSSYSLSAIKVVSSVYLRLLIFLPEILILSLCFIQPSVSHDVLCI